MINHLFHFYKLSHINVIIAIYTKLQTPTKKGFSIFSFVFKNFLLIALFDGQHIITSSCIDVHIGTASSSSDINAIMTKEITAGYHYILTLDSLVALANRDVTTNASIEVSAECHHLL
jgi:hypothetical protein